MAIDLGKLLASTRRFAAVAVAAVVLLFVGCTSTKRIDAGHVGIRVKLAGSDRGVQNMEVKTGWVLYNPVLEEIVIFPTNVQNVVWTQSAHEARNVDESLTFSSSEGVNINGDIGMSFHIDPPLAPQLYARFRQNDMMALANGYMRNVVREAFNEVASQMPVQEIYGVGKSKMLADVAKRCRDALSKDGIVIDQLTINGALRLPQNVADAINRAMEATQNAIQSENRVRQVRAEAEQAITQATGLASAARQRAQGEADSVLIRARAEARAAEILRLSMSPSVLQYRALERWDGKLPTFQGQGQVPLLTFDVSRAGAGGAGMDEGARQRRLAELLRMEDSAATSATSPSAPAVPAAAAPPAPPAAAPQGTAP